MRFSFLSPFSVFPRKAASSRVAIDTSLRWLVIIFLSGLLVVIGLRMFFSSLQDELSQRSSNERARLFVGEEIIRSIHGIERDLYKMAVTVNPAGGNLVRRNVDIQLRKLQHDLQVLQEGGTVRQEVLLNIEGRDEMVRESTYHPDPDTRGYVMELIELAPLLDQIREKSQELQQLLVRRWEAQDQGNRDGILRQEEQIATFLKHVPPLFHRLDENANRLFFDSNEHLRLLEAQIAVQKERLALAELGLLVLVVALAGLVGILFIRRIQRLNQAREDALATAREARDEAERASRSKSEFVSRMSHELRTPLNAILGFAQLLEDAALPPEQKHYVTLINGSGNHLMELINAVLDHAKIEAGSLVLEKIAFDLPEAIGAVASIVHDKARSKGLAFIADITPDLPRHIEGDPTRLRQVLINLLNNAVKFTETGSVELRAGVDEGSLVISIRDTGIGMDDNTLQRLFHPFAQADESITRKYGGTGLGLLISRELVEAMGGDIQVDSAVGVGTCFWVHLPLQIALAPEPSPQQSRVASGVEDMAALVGGPILLVDDNSINQQLGAAMLTRLGLDYDLADNGRHCLERLQQRDYRLVLMDMEMPEMDGVTTTREIRRREAGQGKAALPIIAMTANALAEDRARCLEAGMDGYISKPIRFAAMVDEFRRVLGNISTSRQAPTDLALRAIKDQASTAHQPPSAAPLPVYNRAQGIDMVGDEELFAELEGIFAADAPALIQSLGQALDAADWPTLNRSAHTIKGLFGTLAANGFIEAARQLEHAARDGDAERCHVLVPLIQAHIQNLVEAFPPLRVLP